MEKLILIFEEHLRKWGAYVIGVPVYVMAIIETLNAFGRKLLVPFPCAVETVESLLIITTYFGISIVALERGHVKVELLTSKLPRSYQNYLTILGDFVGAMVFGLISWGAWRMATYATKIAEARQGVYWFPLWPFKVLFAVGMTLLVIQLAINIIKLTFVSSWGNSYANKGKMREAET